MATPNDRSRQLQRIFNEIRLVNGSVGDPALYVDAPGRDNALLFDAGENGTLGLPRLADLQAVFITHHHIDHFIGFDRIVRANLDRDKTLQVFGPEGTIVKVYRRVKSYEYPFFPFQKLVMNVHEILPGRLRRASLECSRRFPRPVVQEGPWDGPVVHERGDLVVEAEHVEHTTPCLAFALVERPGASPDAKRMGADGLAEGPWIGQALTMIRDGAPLDSPVTVHGRPIPLQELRDRYFSQTPGARVAYVTDTLWSDRTRPALVRLAGGADRLYCDSFYAHEHLEQARKYRHMTATQAAELAGLAGVHELVLIHFASRYQGRYDALVAEARALFGRVSADIPAADEP